MQYSACQNTAKTLIENVGFTNKKTAETLIGIIRKSAGSVPYATISTVDNLLFVKKRLDKMKKICYNMLYYVDFTKTAVTY